jgi:serine/threonine protein kinase
MAPEAIAPVGFSGEGSNQASKASATASLDKAEQSDGAAGSLCMRLGRASDIWSLGCILYQMVYGRPPFSALNTIQKLHAIPNPDFPIPYPHPPHDDVQAVHSIQACLQRNAAARAAIRGPDGLLQKPFLRLSSGEKVPEKCIEDQAQTLKQNAVRYPNKFWLRKLISLLG